MNLKYELEKTHVLLQLATMCFVSNSSRYAAHDEEGRSNSSGARGAVDIFILPLDWPRTAYQLKQLVQTNSKMQ